MRGVGHNACRNPDKDATGPWCFVVARKDRRSDNRPWFEHCTIPRCTPPTEAPKATPEIQKTSNTLVPAECAVPMNEVYHSKFQVSELTSTGSIKGSRSGRSTGQVINNRTFSYFVFTFFRCQILIKFDRFSQYPFNQPK